MKNLLTLMLAVCIMGGCAANEVWTRPGMTKYEFDRDAAQCRYEATAATQNVDYGYPRGTGAFRWMRLIELCMKAKGYVQKASTASPAQRYDEAKPTNESKTAARKRFCEKNRDRNLPSCRGVQ